MSEAATQQEIEIAWAAGFWDGEGCCYRGKGGDLRMSISQCSPEPLERFQKAIGFGNVTGPYGYPDKPEWRPAWFWRVQGRKAHQAMALLLPLVSTEKRAQYQRIASLPIEMGQLSIATEPIFEHLTLDLQGANY